jgi:hypothetical protein
MLTPAPQANLLIALLLLANFGDGTLESRAVQASGNGSVAFMSALLTSQLTIAPLGAGDLIDRAVRLYRRHFFTLIRIATPPVIVSAIGSVLFVVSRGNVFTTSSTSLLVLYVLLGCAGVSLMIAGKLFSLIVMGGATRNLVAHLLRNEPVSARATYVAVRSRFWGLLGASLLVLFWVGFSGMTAVVAWYMVIFFVLLGGVAFAQVAPVWLAVILGSIVSVAAAGLAVWLFFFLAGRLAYVPQAMLVEGKGVLDAVARSFSLARGNIRRLMAMVVFTSFAFYSALAILVIPLGWYAYVSGVDLAPFSQGELPAWYAIGYNVIWDASNILPAPVWMLGMSLLYVDERVRHEGYDIELMAARQLPEMPKLDVASPLAPALAERLKRTAPPPPPLPRSSVLGLS